MKLLNRFKYGNHQIELYKVKNYYSAAVDSERTAEFNSIKQAFLGALDIMEKKSRDLANELRSISKQMTLKTAKNPASVIRKIEKDMKADMEVHVLSRSYPGSYDYPPEPAEFEVKDAYIEFFPDLTIEEAEALPNVFECSVYENYSDDREEAGFILNFEVRVLSKNIQKNGMVEIEFEDSFIDWDHW